MASRTSLQRNVCTSWLAHAITMVCGFALMPYVIYTLGDSAYGSWVFINSIASYAGLLYFGFGATIGRYTAKYEAAREWDNLNSVVTLILTIYLAMGAFALCVAGGLAVGAPLLQQWTGNELFEVRLVILLLGLNVAAGLAGSVFGGVLMGAGRLDLEKAVAFTSDLVRVALIFVFLRREWGLSIIAAIYLLITVAEGLTYVFLAYRVVPQLQVHRRYLKWSVFKECVHFSGFSFLNTIASQLIYATDTVVIGCMLGTRAIVPYYIALRLTDMIRKPIQQISEVCMPAAGAMQARADTRSLHQLVFRALGFTLLLSVGTFIGAMYFGEQVVVAWMGPNYPESQLLLAILLGAQIAALPVGVLRAVMFGMGQVRGPSLIYLAEAVINIVLSVILCRWLGLWGVALGTAIPLLLCELGVLLPLSLSYLGIRGSDLLRNAVLPQALPLAGLWAYAILASAATSGQQTWPVLLATAIGGASTLAAGWLVQNYITKKLEEKSLKFEAEHS